MSSFLFELKNVSYHYPEAVALDGVTLSIAGGERVALLGANGSGKSTLLRILAGLNYSESGSVVFCGTPLSGDAFADGKFAREFRRRVGVLFQNPELQLFNPTVFDEVAFGPLQLGWTKKEVLERVEAQLEALEIGHLRNRSPHRLSGGEKKRVALASVLVLDPDVLLVDEPTAALDPKSQGQIIDFLFECAGRKTVVTATHNLDIVGDVADRCVVLEGGRVAADGPPSGVLGDLPLLERTHLVLAHRHRHPSGLVHSHPHLYGRHGH